jgi:hypothetical protein
LNDKVNLDVVKGIVAKAATAPTVVFTDISKTSWSTSAIDLAAKIGIVKGYEDGTFHADAKVTRAEFATMLVNALGLSPTGSSNFSDTKGHWAADAIRALQSSGVINGYKDGSFKPNQEISRAEIVAMLARVMNFGQAPATDKFTDVKGNFAADAINALGEAGIVSGNGKDSFNPNTNASRAESVVMILRMLNVTLDLGLNL